MNQVPLVMEIVGPAGAGKTTLCRALAQHNPAIQVGLRLRDPRYLPLFVRQGLWTLPVLLHKPPKQRWLTTHELRVMVYLQVLHQVAARATQSATPAIVLDQGPVYKLAELRSLAQSLQPYPSFAHWWEQIAQQWASTLHLIVQLDAAEPVLLRRIRQRHKWHRAKEAPAAVAQQILQQSRTAVAQTVASLTTHGGPQVVQFNTSQTPLAQLVEQVLHIVEGGTQQW